MYVRNIAYSEILKRNYLIYQNWFSLKEKYKNVECNEALQWEAELLCKNKCG